MGRAAKEVKDRRCWTCLETFNVIAKDIKRHAVFCAEAKDIANRLKAIGMVNPNRDLVIRRVDE